MLMLLNEDWQAFCDFEMDYSIPFEMIHTVQGRSKNGGDKCFLL